MKYSNILLILLLFLGVILNAQDLKTDLEKVNASYKDKTSLALEMKVNVFKGSTKVGKPVYTNTTAIYKLNDNYLYKVEDLTMLYNEDYVVMVDKENTAIVYTERAEEEIEIEYMIMPNLDSIMSFYEKINYKGLVEGNKHYVVTVKGGAIKRVEFFIDAKAAIIKKVIYNYDNELFKQNSCIEMTFTKVDLAPKFSKATFSEEQFFVKKGKTYKVAPLYKKYELISTKSYE